MNPELGAIAFSLMAFVGAALFWWRRQLGMKDGRLDLAPSFSREDYPRIFKAISWFYVVMVLCFCGLGVSSLVRFLLGL